MFTRPSDTPRSAQRFFAPEVIQTSAMDCGPAALKCLLEGFGIPVSYGRLREACQTDVDGTSIDTIEDIARQLGLAVEQVMMPVDHLFLSALPSLPALIVVLLPAGHPHFLVVWRTHGAFVQVMDPANGRRWLTQARLLQEVYRHTLPIDAENWLAWANSDGLLVPLQQRLQKLGVASATINHLVAEATQDDSWFGLALLDAATRLVTAVVAAKGIQPGAAAATLLETLLAQAHQQGKMDEETRLRRELSRTRQGDKEGASSDNPLSLSPAARYASSSQVIPASFWVVRPLPPPLPTLADEPPTERLLLHGAVLVRVLGREDAALPIAEAPSDAALGEEKAAAPQPSYLAPELVAALQEAPARPEWEVWRSLRADGLLTPSLLLVAATLATLGVLVEATLLRGLLDLATKAQLPNQSWASPGIYLLFMVLLAALEFPLNSNLVRMGRRLETRLRIAFLTKLPRLSDRYFHSRLISDMAQRAYGLRQLRELPGLALRAYRTGFQLLLTAVGISWLSPICAPLALLAVVWSMGCSLLAQWVLAEQDSRIRTQAAALTRFYLDGLLGLIPVRTHAGERALRREHEGILVKWLAASETFFRSDLRLQAVEAVGSYGCTVAIVFYYLLHGGEASGVLLLLYWALNLSGLGQSFTTTLRQYPAQRNHVLRVLEPLGAPEEGAEEQRSRGAGETNNTVADDIKKDIGKDEESATLSPPHLVTLSSAAVAIQIEGVAVLAGGHTILHDINLAIGAGEHIALVGASGAGKSTLVGLLLGWHRPAQGKVSIDGVPLTGELLSRLRQQTAWVDPAVQVWNRSLWENLRYGAAASSTTGGDDPSLAQVMEQADLYSVLESLPNGLQTSLGEGGGLVSGGEGQRVRLGRAMARPGVRLAILDEPFRGLDRTKRRQLLRNARVHWHNATLLCVTHDVGETQQFDRVLVVEHGQIVEDDTPQALTANPDSLYYRLLQAEDAVRTGMWQGAQWRHLRMEEGKLQEVGL